MKYTVNNTTKENLCISCGICEAICPVNAINMYKKRGMYIPDICTEVCIKCGKCYDFCPGKGIEFSELYELRHEKQPKDYYVGNVIKCYNAFTRDKLILKNSTSGGTITQLIYTLLKTGEYDCAFCVDSFDYSDKLSVKKIDSLEELSKTSKSRYIPVTQEKAITYLLKNKEKRIIFVGTPCFIQGLSMLISRQDLDRDKYLMLGLFCDRTMNYNIFDYFSKYYGRGKKLKELIFRTKELEGWPGNIKLVFEDHSERFLPSKIRGNLKEFFTPERCLYCLDKLNQFSDIAVGDNYTGDSTGEGSSSLVIRTEQGACCWEKIKNEFEWREVSIDKIKISQKIGERCKNYKYKKLKNISINENIDKLEIDEITRKEYNELLEKISLGEKGDYTRIYIKVVKKRLYRIVRKLFKYKNK